MMNKPIYLFCAVCLAGGCTGDPATDPARPGSTSGEPVPVHLELHMADFTAPASRITRSIQAVPNGTRGVIDAEISSLEPAPRTQADAGTYSVIADDEKIFRLDILQFDGSGADAQLVKKAVLERSDGDISNYDFSTLTFLSSETKNRIVVLGNADPALYDKLKVQTPSAAGTAFSTLQLENIPRNAQNQETFPCVLRQATNVPVISGMSVSNITTGLQIGVELTRSIAKSNFEFFLSDAMLSAYSEWDIVLHNIPPVSFYTPQIYTAPFPQPQTDESFYSQVLAAGVKNPTSSDQPLLSKTLYLPVNLQQSVPGTDVSTRYLHAPPYATYLQLMGKKIVGSAATQVVVYMIPLGANFTDDYSIRPNNAINYRITLASDSPDDSSVVRFIAGKFAGTFRKYTNTADNSECWGYDSDLEVWPTDVQYVRYPGDSGTDFTGTGTWMRWAAVSNLGNTATGVTDGLANTQTLCTTQSNWSIPTAAYMCYRQLNGLTAPLNAPEPNMWFLPAINQLIGVYAAGGAQVSTMQPNYWSSTYLGGSPNQQSIYRMGRDGTVETVLNYSPSGAPKAAVRACRIPPPVSLRPK